MIKFFLKSLLALPLVLGMTAQAQKSGGKSSSSSSKSSTSFFKLNRSGSGAIVHEVGGGFNVFGIAGGGAGSTLDFGKGGTFFSATGSYYRRLDSVAFYDLQVGGAVDMISFGGSTVFLLLGGARFNIGPRMDDAFFVNPSIGFVKTEGSGLVFDVSAGKRFKLLENVVYAPGAGFYFMKAGGQNLFRFHLDPIKFTVIF